MSAEEADEAVKEHKEKIAAEKTATAPDTPSPEIFAASSFQD